MAFRSTVRLDSKIFSESARRAALSRAVNQTLKIFRNSTKQKMIRGVRSGEVRKRIRGSDFRVERRRSAKGERPAPDTFNLVNAVIDFKTSDLAGTVEVDEQKAPYADHLQNDLDRPIMTAEDAREAEIELKRNVNNALKDLL